MPFYVVEVTETHYDLVEAKDGKNACEGLLLQSVRHAPRRFVTRAGETREKAEATFRHMTSHEGPQSDG